MNWKQTINTKFRYRDGWQQLNSADFGAYTSRNRLFGCFAKDGLPIHFPAKQFSKKAENGLPKWKAVKEVLQLDEKGVSIFIRKKPLVEKTLERIYAGLVKFVAEPFISNYKSGHPKSKNTSVNNASGTLTTIPTQALVQSKFIMQYQSGIDPKHYANRIKSCNEPLNTIPTNNRFALVQPQYLLKYNSMNQNGHYVAPGINDPSPVVSTHGRLNLVTCNFISTYYKNGSNVSTDKPAHTLTTKDRLSLITSNFIYRDFKSATNSSIETPAGALVTIPKMNLITSTFILNPQFGNSGNSIEQPCPTIIATQGKRPLSKVHVMMLPVVIFTYKTDSPMMAKIKQFMRIHGISDILMRMLFVDELKRIQGFPNEYVLLGSQAHQKKYIGNSVVPQVVKAWIESLNNYINNNKKVA